MGIAVIGKFIAIKSNAAHQPFALVLGIITKVAKRPGIDLDVFDISIGQSTTLDRSTPVSVMLDDIDAGKKLFHHNRCLSGHVRIKLLPVRHLLRHQVDHGFEHSAVTFIQHGGKGTTGKWLTRFKSQYFSFWRFFQLQIRKTTAITQLLRFLQDRRRQRQFFQCQGIQWMNRGCNGGRCRGRIGCATGLAHDVSLIIQ